MKKLLNASLAFLTAVLTMPAALADVIWDPFYRVPGGYRTVLVAVAAVVLATVLLIRKNRKK